MDINTVIIYLGCLIVLFIVGKVFYLPLKHIIKLLLNSVFGGFLIYIINVVGSSYGFHIGLNVWTAVFAGVLGVPGVVVLVLIRLMIWGWLLQGAVEK